MIQRPHRQVPTDTDEDARGLRGPEVLAEWQSWCVLGCPAIRNRMGPHLERHDEPVRVPAEPLDLDPDSHLILQKRDPAGPTPDGWLRQHPLKETRLPPRRGWFVPMDPVRGQELLPPRDALPSIPIRYADQDQRSHHAGIDVLPEQ